jgi:L-cysteine desulfidase
MNKSLSFGGYFIKIPYLFGNKQQYMCCVIRSNLYKHILSILPKNDNKYISYLELYQKNELSDVIVYIHKYPNDVIRRINMAIRTLSKEILNIYHLTRKKQNIVLYTNLSRGYKKVLFELHKIYVTQKHLEISSKQSKNGAQLIEKKSISVDVVYDYLKSINVSDLIQIFKDRTEIINALVDENYKLYNIFNLNDIYIVTQIELMFNKN